MQQVLKEKFFNRPTLAVAKALLGKYLVRKIGGKVIAARVVEVEAYVGEKDKASHARFGETKRNAVMFGRAGRVYIYFVYGMHWLLNVVTEGEGKPAAILIRGIEGAIGPARLTKKLTIDGSLSGKLAVPATGLWFEDRGEPVSRKDIQKTPRIGVDYAGPIWSKKHYRFLLKNKSPSGRGRGNKLC